MSKREIVIVDGVRTPIGRAVKGSAWPAKSSAAFRVEDQTRAATRGIKYRRPTYRSLI